MSDQRFREELKSALVPLVTVPDCWRSPGEIADALLPLIAEHTAQVLERCYREDRTTVAKMTPVEQLTCFVVKVEDMVVRAADLRAKGGQAS